MSKLSGEFREPNRKDKVTRFPFVSYARQLGLLVNTLGSHLKLRPSILQTHFQDSSARNSHKQQYLLVFPRYPLWVVFGCTHFRVRTFGRGVEGRGSRVTCWGSRVLCRGSIFIFSIFLNFSFAFFQRVRRVRHARAQFLSALTQNVDNLSWRYLE